MNPWLMLCLSMLAAQVSGIFTKFFTIRYAENKFAKDIFTVATALVAAVVLFVWCENYTVSLFTILLSVAFGIVTSLQKVFSLNAMETGPWAYTSVISSLSSLIPALSGAIFWNESIALIQWIGMALMVVCIFLSADFKKDTGKKSIKWLLFCAGTFVTTGFIGVMQKIHQSSEFKGELDMFLIFAFIFSAAFSSLTLTQTYLKTAKEERENAKHDIKMVLKWLIIGLMVVCAGGVAVNNKFNLYLSGVMDSAVFFPIVNGGGLTLTTIFAVVIFKERLTIKQWIGLIVGFAAVMCLANPF